MLCTVAVFNRRHCANAYAPTDTTELGIVTSVRKEWKNAFSPIEVTEFGMRISVKAVCGFPDTIVPENALAPMVVTVFGKMTDRRDGLMLYNKT